MERGGALLSDIGESLVGVSFAGAPLVEVPLVGESFGRLTDLLFTLAGNSIMGCANSVGTCMPCVRVSSGVYNLSH